MSPRTRVTGSAATVRADMSGAYLMQGFGDMERNYPEWRQARSADAPVMSLSDLYQPPFACSQGGWSCHQLKALEKVLTALGAPGFCLPQNFSRHWRRQPAGL